MLRDSFLNESPFRDMSFCWVSDLFFNLYFYVWVLAFLSENMFLMNLLSRAGISGWLLMFSLGFSLRVGGEGVILMILLYGAVFLLGC